MIKRTIYQRVLKSIDTRPVTLITGARQVGKSTICLQIAKERNFEFVSLDDSRNLSLAKSDPAMFLQVHKPPLIIDEVQKAPELFTEIQSIVNEAKYKTGNNYGMFVLTGSESFGLMKNVSESMAGRVSIIRVTPLSRSEILCASEEPFSVNPLKNAEKAAKYPLNLDELLGYMTRGFYPELYANRNIDYVSFYSDYLSTYVDRDVCSIINIVDKLKFHRFMQYLASITGQQLVIESICNAVEINSRTANAWLSVLEASDIIHLLQPFNSHSLTKRISKKPKIYFSDTGLVTYLVNLSNPEALKMSPFFGAFVETYVVNEIRKSYINNGSPASLYYYRDSNMNEIDLIIELNGTLNLIECKSGITVNSSSVRFFSIFGELKTHVINTSGVLCNSSTIYKIKDGVWAVPIASI